MIMLLLVVDMKADRGGFCIQGTIRVFESQGGLVFLGGYFMHCSDPREDVLKISTCNQGSIN